MQRGEGWREERGGKELWPAPRHQKAADAPHLGKAVPFAGLRGRRDVCLKREGPWPRVDPTHELPAGPLVSAFLRLPPKSLPELPHPSRPLCAVCLALLLRRLPTRSIGQNNKHCCSTLFYRPSRSNERALPHLPPETSSQGHGGSTLRRQWGLRDMSLMHTMRVEELAAAPGGPREQSFAPGASGL